MKGVFSILVLVLTISCNQGGTDNVSGKEEAPDDKISKGAISRIDSLSFEETTFLNKLVQENESLTISNQVERFFEGSDSIPTVNKLVFPKHILIDKGYVYLELEFYGNINDANISYRFSLGQADTGYGSVSGNDTSDYVHTHKSCGVTACITQVFNNGKKIFEKEEPN